MPAEHHDVIKRLALGDATAVAAILDRARTSHDMDTLVAAALSGPATTDLMQRAGAMATTTRDRQLVAIATAHLAGDAGRVADLAREHLADHPDSVVVAWITASNQSTRTREDPS